MSNDINNYLKKTTKTKVLSVRIDEDLLNQYNQFKKDVNARWDFQWNTKFMIEREIKRVINSFNNEEK